MYDYPPVLIHHGVPGQRKGVLHGPPYPILRDSNGRPRSVVSINKKQMTKNTRSKFEGKNIDQNGGRVKKKIRVSSMTNEELEARIKRIELEKKYKDLVRGPVKQKDKKSVSEGKKMLYKVLGDIGTAAAKTVIDATLGQFVPVQKEKRRSMWGQHQILQEEREKRKTKEYEDARKRRRDDDDDDDDRRERRQDRGSRRSGTAANPVVAERAIVVRDAMESRIGTTLDWDDWEV